MINLITIKENYEIFNEFHRIHCIISFDKGVQSKKILDKYTLFDSKDVREFMSKLGIAITLSERRLQSNFLATSSIIEKKWILFLSIHKFYYLVMIVLTVDGEADC